MTASMTTQTTISLSLIFALIAVIGTVFNIAIALKNNNEKETSKRLDIEKQFVRLNVKLDDMSITMSELLKRNEKSILEIQEINKKLILQNERVEMLYKFKDRIETRVTNLENGRNK